jgi:hypothetical protein
MKRRRMCCASQTRSWTGQYHRFAAGRRNIRW